MLQNKIIQISAAVLVISFISFVAWFIWKSKNTPLDCKHAVSFQKWYEDGKEYDVSEGANFFPYCQGTSKNVKVWVKPTMPLVNETKDQFLSRCNYKAEKIDENCKPIPPTKHESKEAWMQRCLKIKQDHVAPYSYCSLTYSSFRNGPEATIYTPTKDEYMTECRRKHYRDSSHCESQYKHWANEGKNPIFIKHNLFGIN